MVITNKICVCREQTNFENVRTFVDIEIAVQIMIFITFETPAGFPQDFKTQKLGDLRGFEEKIHCF